MGVRIVRDGRENCILPPWYAALNPRGDWRWLGPDIYDFYEDSEWCTPEEYPDEAAVHKWESTNTYLNLFYGAILVSLLLVSCTGGPKVSFETVEDARKQAREQAASLAQEYRAAQGLSDYKIDARGDSTIDASCPQGDGWASAA